MLLAVINVHILHAFVRFAHAGILYSVLCACVTPQLAIAIAAVNENQLASSTTFKVMLDALMRSH